MNVELLLSILFAIVLLIISLDFDEGIILIILGFLSIGVALNLETLFDITSSSYNGWGELITLVYVMVGLFSFVKTYYQARSIRRDSTMGVVTNGR